MLLPHRQQGIALVMAIMIVTLAAITATAITVINQRQVIRTSNIILRDQAYHFATNAELYSISILNQDAKDNNEDHLDEDWYNKGEESLIPIDFANIQDSERFYIQGRLIDLQSRLNINYINSFPDNGASTGHTRTLPILLDNLGINIKTVVVLQDSLADWVDSNDDPLSSSGAEQYFYLGLDKPYQAANTTLLHTSTLRQIRGFDEIEKEGLDRLREEIYTLPDNNKLNVNTASEPVLRAIGLDNDTITRVKDNRPYEDINNFITHANAQNGITFNANNFTVESEYFLLDATATMDKAKIRINSIIKRDNSSNKSRVILRIIGDY